MNCTSESRGYFPRVRHQPRAQEDDVSVLDQREPLTPLEAAARQVQKGWEDVS